jgi:hypothetical protein
MRRFAIKLGLFAALFVLWQLSELFILPITAFTFRPWEALVVSNLPWTYIGPFYPNQHVVMDSVGANDHFSRKPNPTRKHEEWFTDGNGYRNRPRPSPLDGYDVVVLGDSLVVGAFLDQKNTLAEVLERECKCAVYNLGGGTAYANVDDDGFIRHPPRFLVRDVQLNPVIDDNTRSGVFTFFGYVKRPDRIWPKWTLVLLDRIRKQASREFFRARLGITEISRWSDYADSQLASSITRAAPSHPPEAKTTSSVQSPVDRAEKESLETAARLKAQGTELILLFIPEANHSVYEPLIERLRTRGIRVVDFPATKEWPKGYPDSFHQSADSHWTEEAVREAARRILEQMQAARKVNAGHAEAPR